MVKMRIVRYKGGRREIQLEDPPPATKGDQRLGSETSVLWLEPIEELDFVRVAVVRTCKTPSGHLKPQVSGRVIGYSKLRDDAPKDADTGGYVRRIFFLKDADIEAGKTETKQFPKGAVDPQTIGPGVAGKAPSVQPTLAKPSPTPQPVKPQVQNDSVSVHESDDDDFEAVLRGSDSGLFGDNVLDWLDNPADKFRPADKAGGNSQSQIDTELAHDVPEDGRSEAAIDENEMGFFGELIPMSPIGTKATLTKRKIMVGRMDQCDVIIDFHKVSGLHCELTFDKGFWTAKDLNSTNGVVVNGFPLAPGQSKRLDPGAVLSIAQVDFEIRYAPDHTAAQDDPSQEDTKQKALDPLMDQFHWPKKR